MARNKQTQNTPIPLEQQPFRLPENWQWVRLGEILDVRDGTHDTPKYVTNGIPLITSKNLSNGRIDFSTAKFISQEDHYAISQRSKVDKNDILFAMIGSIGNPVLFNGEEEFSIKNMALFKHVTDNISMKYVYWFLFFEQDKMKIYATGGLQPFVSLNYLRKYLFPLPPLSEQHRIVEKIEQLFTQLDQAAEKLTAVIDGFELRKTAILHKAFTGELSKQWRMKNNLNLNDWQNLTLNDIAEYKKGPFGSSITKSMFVPKGNHTYKVYEQGNAIRKTVHYGTYYINEQKFNELKNFAVQANDIIISCAGTIGEVYKLPQDCEIGVINQALMRVRVYSNTEEKFFIYYFGEMIKDNVIKQSNGTAIKNIPPFKIMKAMSIKLPPLSEQKEIVRILDNLLTQEQNAKQQAEDALQKIALIKKAILAQAFRGEL